MWSDFVEGCFCSSFLYKQGYDLTHWHAHAGWRIPRSQCVWLFHAVPQHLIGGDEHDADDEGHGEGADEALPYTRLSILL